MSKENPGIGATEVAFVGYPATDMEKSRTFYGDLLGLKESMVFEQDGIIHWLEFDVAGVPLALGKASEDWQPNPQGGGVALEVKNLEATLDYLKQNGVEPAMQTADFHACQMAVIPDPDGNGIILHQRKAHHPDHS